MLSITPPGRKGRRLDSHQHHPPVQINTVKTGALLSRATSAKAGVQGIEPCWAVLEAACFPEAHSCISKGYPTGVEPVLPASQAGVRTTYTTDTIFSSSTRIRTWNLSLEARHDVRFTIEP